MNWSRGGDSRNGYPSLSYADIIADLFFWDDVKGNYIDFDSITDLDIENFNKQKENMNNIEFNNFKTAWNVKHPYLPINHDNVIDYVYEHIQHAPVISIPGIKDYALRGLHIELNDAQALEIFNRV